MGDIYKEQIVKKKPSTADMLKRVGLVLAVVIIFLACVLILPSMAFIVAAAAGFGAYLLMGMLNVEYEYIFTNGELDIDIIYSKTRRKRVYSGSVKDFEIMAHVEDKMHVHEFSNINETKDYSSGVVNANTYAFMTNYKSKHIKVIFEPNEMMLKAIATVISPRKLFKKQ